MALQAGNVGLEPIRIESTVQVEPQSPFRRVPVRLGERDKDDVPLRRDLAKRKHSSPIPDHPIPIPMFRGRSAERNRRDCGFWRYGDQRRDVGTGWPAALDGRSKRLCVRKAIRVASIRRDAHIPGEQGYILQVVCGSARMSDKGF